MPKVKDKEKLKSNKRKEESNQKRSAHKTMGWFFKINIAGKKGLARIYRDEKQGPTSKVTLSSKPII